MSSPYYGKKELEAYMNLKNEWIQWSLDKLPEITRRDQEPLRTESFFKKDKS